MVPTGYSFNPTAHRYTRARRHFIAQLYGIDLSLWQEIVLVLTLMVTSKGIAGVPPCVSFVVVLLATLGSGHSAGNGVYPPVSTVSSTWRRTAPNAGGECAGGAGDRHVKHKLTQKRCGLTSATYVLGKFDKTAQ